MSGIDNMSIIFYSLWPADRLSKLCMQEIAKIKDYKSQFIMVCVHDEAGNIKPSNPNIVKTSCERMSLPVLAAAGFPSVIVGDQVYEWIKDSKLHKRKRMLAGNISAVGDALADNSASVKQTERNGSELFRDSQFNMCFDDAKTQFNKSYANYEEGHSATIDTFVDHNTAHDHAKEIEKRMKTLKFDKSIEHIPTSLETLKAMPTMLKSVSSRGTVTRDDMSRAQQARNMGMPTMHGPQPQARPQPHFMGVQTSVREKKLHQQHMPLKYNPHVGGMMPQRF